MQHRLHGVYAGPHGVALQKPKLVSIGLRSKLLLEEWRTNLFPDAGLALGLRDAPRAKTLA